MRVGKFLIALLVSAPAAYAASGVYFTKTTPAAARCDANAEDGRGAIVYDSGSNDGIYVCQYPGGAAGWTRTVGGVPGALVMGEYHWQGNTTATVITTGSTWTRVAIAGTLSVDENFDSNADGRLRYIGDETIMAHCGVTLSVKSAAASDVMKAIVYQNGTVNGNNEYTGGTALTKGTTHQKLGAGGDVASTAIHVMPMMDNGDYLELAIRNDTGTADFTVTDANMFCMTMPLSLASVSNGDKGDITVASSGTAWTIDANAVVESDLKAVDSAADEECLTYETTTGDFEWQACGGGGGNSFETINAPAGTDPVADSSTDTLALTCAAPLTCTGDATADSIAFGWAADDISFSGATAGDGAELNLQTSLGPTATLVVTDGVDDSRISITPTTITLDGAIFGATASRCARFDGTGNLVSASGDCSSGDTTTPAADAVTEAMLKAVDAASDEECLTYETTTGDFEWQACGGGSGTVTSVAATVPEDLAVSGSPVTTSGTLAITAAAGGILDEYDTDRHATAGNYAIREDWDGDTAEQTWAWANQDSATESVSLDGLWLTGDTTDELHIRYVSNLPTGVDFVAATKLTGVLSTNLDSCGMTLLTAGTEGSPTGVESVQMSNFPTDAIAHYGDTDYVQSGATSRGSFPIAIEYFTIPVCLQFRYVDSTRVLTSAYAHDCKNWRTVGTTTLGADPTASIGLHARRGGACRYEWFVARTDATGIAAPYPSGE